MEFMEDSSDHKVLTRNDATKTAGELVSGIFSHMQHVHPVIGWAMKAELERHRNTLDLIASENYCSINSNLALSSLLSCKYAEGFPGKRFYGGCAVVDVIENEAIQLAKELFGAEAAFVQPESGSTANMIAYSAVLYQCIILPHCKSQGTSLPKLSEESFDELRHLLIDQKILSLSLQDGGHISHGLRMNRSGQMFKVYHYKTTEKGMDYDAIEQQAMAIKPLIIVAGATAFPLAINFKRMREIADKCGAILIADMAHIAGLVAGKVLTDNFNPVPFADIVTSTTHKTLRGPRSGLILCKEKFIDSINKACPLVMGGPCIHTIAAKAIAFKEALSPEFQTYAQNVVSMAKALAGQLLKRGISLAYRGTDTHIILVDLSEFGISGVEVETELEAIGIICNKNAIPKETSHLHVTSGIRIGTSGITSRGMGIEEAIEIGNIIADFLFKLDSKNHLAYRVRALTDKFPLHPEIELPSEMSVCAINREVI